jgi:hypothetical protein
MFAEILDAIRARGTAQYAGFLLVGKAQSDLFEQYESKIGHPVRGLSHSKRLLALFPLAVNAKSSVMDIARPEIRQNENAGEPFGSARLDNCRYRIFGMAA